MIEVNVYRDVALSHEYWNLLAVVLDCSWIQIYMGGSHLVSFVARLK